jgi:hypothetical protein
MFVNILMESISSFPWEIKEAILVSDAGIEKHASFP